LGWGGRFAITLSLLLGLGLVVKAVRHPQASVAQLRTIERSATAVADDSTSPAGTQRGQNDRDLAAILRQLAPAPYIVGATGLNARPRLIVPLDDAVEVGTAIETGEHQRSRISLPDGSVLYANAGFGSTGERSISKSLRATKPAAPARPLPSIRPTGP
jgi:hypothetical protein